MTMFAPQIARLGEISDRYDAILCDIWGVLHNGVASFVEASKSLASFRRRGGAVILITNAPRPSAVIRGITVTGPSLHYLFRRSMEEPVFAALWRSELIAPRSIRFSTQSAAGSTAWPQPASRDA
jgi:haloacid dehalogenase-like hydrolase